ncbi:MAG: phage tail protein [bacterium]|nr:phage tail protein [bacterium]
MPEFLDNVLSRSNFKVEIEGADYGNFTSVSGLGCTADMIDDTGGTDSIGRKLPSKVKYETVSMTRNWDGKDTALRDWWELVETRKVKARGDVQKSVSIILLDHSGKEEITRRNLMGCIPCGWSMSDLGAGEAGALTETIQLTYDEAQWG